MRRLAAASLLLLSTCREGLEDVPTAVFFADRLPSAERSADGVASSDFRAVPMTLDSETRLAVAVPLASRLGYSVDVPPAPRFRFATALFPLRATGDDQTGAWETLRQMEFRVHVETTGTRATVFSEIVRRHEAGGWIDRSVDLAPWAGDTVKLSFETQPPARFLRDPAKLRTARQQYLALWGNPVLDSAEADKAGPHVILISLDCLRADRVFASTPVLETFAEDAVAFERAIATAPSTLPSHTSMLTGLSPLLHGANKWRARDPSAPYLPELLAHLGYEVNGVVSGPYLSQSFGFESGFHTYKFNFDPRAGDTIDDALAVLDRASARRQFLFLHLFDPHAPYFPPRAFLPRDELTRRDVLSLMNRVMQDGREPSASELEALTRLYDAEVAYMDRQLGRFLDELEARGLYEDALIIITADHGEAFYEHGQWQHSRSLYEEIVHVPLMVKWPGSSPTGTAGELVSHVDILPTVLAEAGAVEPGNSMGESLRRVVETGGSDRRRVLSEFEWLLAGKTVMKIALRGEGTKYIATLEAPPGAEMTIDAVVSEELYALDVDPGERDNVVAEAPTGSEAFDEREAFRELLASYLKTVYRARRPGARLTLDDETEEQLRSLGYVYD